MTSPVPVPPTDVTLTEVVAGIEAHAGAAGWDRPPVLFALVRTQDLIAQQPGLAEQLGLDTDVGPDDLTPVEQEELGDTPLEEVLAAMAWPPEVMGCALVHEVLVLPPSVEALAPGDDDPTLATWAAQQPERREVRMVAGVLRDGTRVTALRLRPADADAPTPSGPEELLLGADLAPALSDALLATWAD